MDVDQRPTASTDQRVLIGSAAASQPAQTEQKPSSYTSDSLAPTPVLERPRQDGVPEGTFAQGHNSPGQKGKTITMTQRQVLF